MVKAKENKAKTKEENNSIEIEKKFNRFLEEVKITNDYLKHIATLDTGSIVILATFLQRSDRPNGESLLAFSVIFLVASLAGVVATQIDLVNRLSASADDVNMVPLKIEKIVYRIGTYIAYTGFILGLSCLGTFVFYTVTNISK